MNTKEYFAELNRTKNDNLHPEFHTFATVWMRSRMPEMYQDLASRYQHLEPEIMAQMAIDDAQTEMPF